MSIIDIDFLSTMPQPNETAQEHGHPIPHAGVTGPPSRNPTHAITAQLPQSLLPRHALGSLVRLARDAPPRTINPLTETPNQTVFTKLTALLGVPMPTVVHVRSARRCNLIAPQPGPWAPIEQPTPPSPHSAPLRHGPHPATGGECR